MKHLFEKCKNMKDLTFYTLLCWREKKRQCSGKWSAISVNIRPELVSNLKLFNRMLSMRVADLVILVGLEIAGGKFACSIFKNSLLGF